MTSNQCLECKNYWGINHCHAFPDDPIPEKILTGEFDHSKKYPGQKNDIVFEPIQPEVNNEKG